jgi:hypothetical protein
MLVRTESRDSLVAKVTPTASKINDLAHVIPLGL